MNPEEIQKAAAEWAKSFGGYLPHDVPGYGVRVESFLAGYALAQKHSGEREKDLKSLVKLALMALTDSQAGFVCERRIALEDALAELGGGE